MGTLTTKFAKPSNEANVAEKNRAFNEVWSNRIKANLPRGIENDVTGVASLFNSWQLFNVDPSASVLLDSELASTEQKENSCPTAAWLVNHALGGRQYDFADFVYLTKYGLIPNNRLITLRRFAQPVMHDITDVTALNTPEIGRMLTYSDGENNGFSSLMSMDWSMKWKQLGADFQDASSQMQGGDASGLNGNLLKIARWLDAGMAKEKLLGQRLFINPMHDQNKVYGPVDSITSTHIRDRGLDFSQNINLTFLYSLKSIDGVDAKAAMLDMLANILAVTYQNGKFWGGAYFWRGPKPSKFWNAAMQFDNQVVQLGLGNSINPSTAIGNLWDAGKKMLNDIRQNGLQSGASKEIAQNLVAKAFTKFLDKVGRPSIPVLNSLLTSDPVGCWHITVGNPLRPMLCIGNLICTGTHIEPVGEELGIDDFPMNWKVTVSLKHAMPLDRAGIEMIFNAGKGRTYWMPNSTDLMNLKSAMASVKQRSNGNWVNELLASNKLQQVYKTIHDFMSTPDIESTRPKLS